MIQQVTKEHLAAWAEDFRTRLKWEQKYLKYSLVELTEDTLTVQYAWKEDTEGMEKHEFIIRTGRPWYSEDLLNEYRRAAIAQQERRLIEKKYPPRHINATISVGSYPESGDGINPYYHR